MRIRCDMVACYIVRRAAGGTEFLQLHRSAGDYLGGSWQTVRGGAEPGERAWEAALRELREETGMVPAEFYKLSHMESFYLATDETIYHVPNFCAIVAADAQVILNEEHDDYRWIPRAQAISAFMWPTEHPALLEIGREILDDGPSKRYLRVGM